MVICSKVKGSVVSSTAALLADCVSDVGIPCAVLLSRLSLLSRLPDEAVAVLDPLSVSSMTLFCSLLDAPDKVEL